MGIIIINSFNLFVLTQKKKKKQNKEKISFNNQRYISQQLEV